MKETAKPHFLGGAVSFNAVELNWSLVGQGLCQVMGLELDDLKAPFQSETFWGSVIWRGGSKCVQSKGRGIVDMYMCFCSRAWVLRGREGGDFAASWRAAQGRGASGKLQTAVSARGTGCFYTISVCVWVCMRGSILCFIFRFVFRGAASCGSHSPSLCANPRGRLLGSWRDAWPVGGCYRRVLESFASFSLPCP